MDISCNFTQFDLNSDGKITPNELDEARAKRMNQNAQDGKMMRNAGKAPTFTDIDTNNDGSITKEEFNSHQNQRMQNK